MLQSSLRRGARGSITSLLSCSDLGSWCWIEPSTTISSAPSSLIATTPPTSTSTTNDHPSRHHHFHASTATTTATTTSPRRYHYSTSNQQPPLPPTPPSTPTNKPTQGWTARLPPSFIPFAHLSRLDKPIGTWLLAWPCFWSIALATPPASLPDPYTLGLFGAGAILLRGAGCTINDLWDRELDKKVERTRTRPLAAGVVTPGQAIGWVGVQLTAGLCILVQLNTYSQILGASSLALVLTYPLMKRITGWPQAFLGLTFNWGALLGWAAVRGECDWGVVLPLYLGGVAWTLVYDTIYAHQDKKDDVKAGIRSTALTFGDHNRRYLAGFAAANVACMAGAGAAVGAGLPFYIGLGAAAAHVGWQVATVDFEDEEDCASKFRSNTWYGALLFSGIVLDKLLAPAL